MTKRSRVAKKLEEKVSHKIAIAPHQRDEDGFYIPYCDCPAHTGVIKNKQTAEMCVEKNCFHYSEYRKAN